MSESTLSASVPEPANRPPAVPVRLALVCAFLIFASCAAWLIYRGATVEVPESMLVVRGSPAWEGAQASVDHVTFHTPLVGHFDRQSRHTISFHLSPGKYTLAIRQGRETLFTYDFELTRRSHIGVLNLPPTLEGLAPTTMPQQPRLDAAKPWPTFFEIEP